MPQTEGVTAERFKAPQVAVASDSSGQALGLYLLRQVQSPFAR